MKADNVYRCGKCGICLQVCPVYKQIPEEAASPRGKIQLIRHYSEQNLATSKNLNEIVSKCLMCGACTESCPSEVGHDTLYMSMRKSMVEDHGQHWLKRILFHFLSHDEQLKLAAKFAAFGRNVVLDKLLNDFRVGNLRIGNLPKFNRKPFRDRQPSVIEPQGKSVGKVLYFSGCATNFVYDKIGNAVVKILTTMGFTVDLVPDQVCCGIPIFTKGSLEQSRDNILTNVALFNKPDVVAVVTDCATCGSTLRKAYPEVLKVMDSPTGEAEELAGKVRDISEFVMEHWELLKPHLRTASKNERVTYHSPCHLRNAQKVGSAVEQLLENLPNVQYVRASDIDNCCGCGGTFFYDYPEIAKKMVDEKIRNAKKTGAHKWATGCPGCRINLSGNLEPDADIELIHPIELICELL